MVEPVSAVIDVTEQTFQSDVVEQSFQRPVVVDFWAEWCGPCRALGPVLEKLVNERQGSVALAKVNTEENQRLAEYFQIESIPAIKVVRDGQIIFEFEGVLPEAQLRRLFDEIAGPATPQAPQPPAPPVLADDDVDPAEAEAKLRKQLEADDKDDKVRIELARVLVRQDKGAEAESVLAPVPPGGESGAAVNGLKAQITLKALAKEVGDAAIARAAVNRDAQDADAHYRLGVALGAAGQHREALDALLAAAELDRTLGNSKVREAMVKLFYVLGVRSELSDEYRNKLSEVLY